MNQQLESENRSALATIASYIAFPYIWLGLFVLLAALYGAGFFGQTLGSMLVLVLLFLVFLLPIVPATLTKFVVKPIVSNLLGREVVSMPGCLAGLASVVLAGVGVIYFLSRGVLETAGWLFLAAPVVGGLLTAGLTLVNRGGGIPALPKSRTQAPPSIEAGKPAPRVLPRARERPALPPGKRPKSFTPAPRQRDRASKPPSRDRTPPPRRRK